VSGWDTEDIEAIVQKRRMRGGSRRASGRGPMTWFVLAIVVLLVVGGGVVFYLTTRPTGLAALPQQAIAAPGGFNATVGTDNTVTIGLEVRNETSVPVTLVSARIVAPAGLTNTALTIMPTGNDNQGFALSGQLPKMQPIQLGTSASTTDAIVAARYTVNCKQLLANQGSVDEAIFVTIEVDGEQREEEITPPVVGTVQWLTASAQRVCLDPVPTGGSTIQPLPPQPGSSPTSG
jgi:hypothetical protein